MTEFYYLATVIAILAGVTFMTRALPFMLLNKVADHPLLQHLGRFLPAMVMVLLVLYSFKKELVFELSFVPELGCLVLVALVHIAFKQALLSIVAGTATYMTLVQFGLA